MGDFPLSILFLMPVTFATKPAFILALVFGGRGVIGGLLVALALIAAYLFWGFALGGIEFTTGMEGIAIFLFPFWWCVAAVWSGLIYLVILLLGWLPRQAKKA